METAKLDPAAAERLKKLQLADLGTARREYISTTDGKKPKDIHPDHIEATRMTNLAGSEAHQAAQANKARLAGWANVHKEIGDTQDLEHLDNLLDGQSHRARLGALIFASGGQAYTKSATKRDNFLKVAETDYGKGHGRRSNSAGRGGGVMGTRGRQSTTPSPNTASTRTSKQGAIMKLGRHIAEAPSGRSRLDPALDSNNDSYRRGREESTKFTARKSGGEKLETTSLRTRRPIVGDYARILSPPESFLAIARSMISTKTSDDTPASAPETLDTRPAGPPKKPKPPTNSDRVTPEKRPDTPRIAKRAVVQPKEAPKTRSIHSPATPTAKVSATSVPSVNTPTKGTAPKANVSSASISSADTAAQGTVPEASVSAASVPPANVYKGSEPMSPGRPEKKSSAPGLISKQVANAESHITNKPTGQTQPSVSQNVTNSNTEIRPVVKAESEPAKASVETTEELLLDFGSTPPDSSPLSDLMTSPAIEDLKGIDFHPSDSVAAHGSTTLDFAESPTPEQPSNGPSIADYQREISLLSALLESTTLGDLGEGFCERLKQCKKELEELCQTQRKSTGSSAINTPVKHERLPSTSPPGSASAQRLRQAVTAPPFYPRTNSFSGYRSPTNSISSDSTAPPPTPVPIRRTAILIRAPPAPAEAVSASDHIFGDHLLPGRHPRTASSLREVSSTSRTSDESSTTKVSFSIPSRETVVLKNVNIPVFESKDKTESSTQPEASNSAPLPQVIKPNSRDCFASTASGNQDATLEVPKNRPTPQVASSVQKTEPAVSSLKQSRHTAQPPTQTHARNNASISQKTEPVARVSSVAREASVPSQRPKAAEEPGSKFSSMGKSIHAASKEPARRPAPMSSSLSHSVHTAPKEVPATRQPVPTGPNGVPKVGSTLKSSERSTLAAPTKTPSTLSGLMSSKYAS